MARYRSITIVLVLIAAGLYGFTRSRRVDLCGELYGFYSSTGEPAERASKLVLEVRRLSSLEKSPTFGAFADVLDTIRDEARYPYSEERGRQLVTALQTTFAPFKQTVSQRCTSLPSVWTSNVDAIVRDIPQRPREHATALEEYRAALDRRARQSKTGVCQGALASWAATRAPVPLSPTHYSKTGGKRVGTAMLEQSEGRWQAQLELGAGEINESSQLDGILGEPSTQCLTLKSSSGASERICGMRATVVTCQVGSGQLLGQAQLTLPPPRHLSVTRFGSVQLAARKALEVQARGDLNVLRFTGVVGAAAGVRRPAAAAPRPRPR